MNFDGLKDDILKMLAGGNADVEVGTFRNDLSDIASKDEALTALIHLGYLGYDAEDLSAYVPNYEVASAYDMALRKSGWSEVANAGSRPAMVIELKYDKTADTAIRQIKDRRYAGALSGYHDKILLVGINYDPDNKSHSCEIEEWSGTED